MKRSNRHKEVLLVGFGILLAGQVLGAEDPIEPVAIPVAIEIDMTAVRIDVAAQVRRIDASLRKAKVTAERPAQLAATGKRARG